MLEYTMLEETALEEEANYKLEDELAEQGNRFAQHRNDLLRSFERHRTWLIGNMDIFEGENQQLGQKSDRSRRCLLRSREEELQYQWHSRYKNHAVDFLS